MIVTGKDNRPLMFFYLRINNWTAGSVYKFHTLLLKRFGGLLIGRETKHILSSLIQRYHPDLMFVHGDWLLDYQIPMGLGIPYILFEHDIHSLRANLNVTQKRYEKTMLEGAAGIIFTSEDHQAHINNNFKVTDNQEVIHLRPLRENLAWVPLRKKRGKHLVYAGGLVNQTNTGGNYGYRSYHPIFEDFIKAGWEVHLYPANDYVYATGRSYERIGCKMYKKLSYNSLLQQMSQYTAGLQSYAKENTPERAFNYTQTCRPNKVWDYLAAGIPTIGLYPGNCAKIYQDGGWGLVIPDTKQSTLENLELPSFSKSLRFEQIMELDLGRFETVIVDALGLREKIKPKQNVMEREGVEVAREGILWYRLEKPVMENGRLLHGRGKRIPIDEAIRLGLVKKETLVKAQIKKRVERKKEKKEELVVEKPKVSIEVKPLVEPPEEKEYRPRKISVPAILEVNEKVEEHKSESDKKERDN